MVLQRDRALSATDIWRIDRYGQVGLEGRVPRAWQSGARVTGTEKPKTFATVSLEVDSLYISRESMYKQRHRARATTPLSLE